MPRWIPPPIGSRIYFRRVRDRRGGLGLAGSQRTARGPRAAAGRGADQLHSRLPQAAGRPPVSQVASRGRRRTRRPPRPSAPAARHRQHPHRPQPAAHGRAQPGARRPGTGGLTTARARPIDHFRGEVPDVLANHSHTLVSPRVEHAADVLASTVGNYLRDPLDAFQNVLAHLRDLALTWGPIVGPVLAVAVTAVVIARRRYHQSLVPALAWSLCSRHRRSIRPGRSLCGPISSDCCGRGGCAASAGSRTWPSS
jgi:hypothetical protein